MPDQAQAGTDDGIYCDIQSDPHAFCHWPGFGNSKTIGRCGGRRSDNLHTLDFAAAADVVRLAGRSKIYLRRVRTL
jgi:hypothetical protein